jgi:regulator of protease activity HflC (stomatin/prohibitin superfamily)
MPPIAFLVLPLIVVLYLLNSIKILKEYERAVVFQLGRVREAAAGPGLILVFAPVQNIVRVSLRQEAMEVPPQDIITRDNVTLKVNAVITLRVVNPTDAVIKVSNYIYQTSQYAQTTLRSVLGEVDLDELLAHRDRLNLRIQSIIDGHTAPFGVKVVSVEVKQVDMPENMLRAMAKQAEAERERRAKIIHAEGEFNAAAKLVEAAALMATQPMTLQLRYLQTLTEIGVEKNTTIVFHGAHEPPQQDLRHTRRTSRDTPSPHTNRRKPHPAIYYRQYGGFQLSQPPLRPLLNGQRSTVN